MRVDTPERRAASVFSFTPPIGSTRPVSVTSPARDGGCTKWIRAVHFIVVKLSAWELRGSACLLQLRMLQTPRHAVAIHAAKGKGRLLHLAG